MSLSCWVNFLECELYFYIEVAGPSQGALVVKNPPANAEVSSTFRLGRSPGGGHGNPFEFSCLETFVDREARQATVLGVATSQTQLKQFRRRAHRGSLRARPNPVAETPGGEAGASGRLIWLMGQWEAECSGSGGPWASGARMLREPQKVSTKEQ